MRYLEFMREKISPVVDYYAGIGTALGTTRSAFPAATAYTLIQRLTPLQTPNLPIRIKTKALAQKIEQELQKKNTCLFRQ